jgi:hypothetical protein
MTIEQLLIELNKIKDKTSKIRVPVHNRFLEDYDYYYVHDSIIENDKITLFVSE